MDTLFKEHDPNDTSLSTVSFVRQALVDFISVEDMLMRLALVADSDVMLPPVN
jgi:hypothetical protein